MFILQNTFSHLVLIILETLSQIVNVYIILETLSQIVNVFITENTFSQPM